MKPENVSWATMAQARRASSTTYCRAGFFMRGQAGDYNVALQCFRGRQSRLIERASLPAIKHIDEEADKQPEDKTDPRFKGKPQHQPATASDGDSRRDRTKRNSKGAGPLGLGAPQNENAYRNDNERKQSSDIRQVGEGVY